MNIVIGFLAIALGAILIIYTEWFVDNFGHSAWAEEKFGSNGGTRTLYKLVGIAIILLALMGMTGMLGNIAFAILGPLFGNLAV